MDTEILPTRKSEDKNKKEAYNIRLRADRWRKLCFLSGQYGANPEEIIERLVDAFIQAKDKNLN